MSLDEYERFVFRACHVEEPGDPVAHWNGVRAELRAPRRRARPRPASSASSGPDTDLKVGVEGRRWQPADGRYNMPDGEVYTSPLETVTEGEISFSFPALFHGREVDGHPAALRGRRGRRGGGRARSRVPRCDARDGRGRAAARRGRLRAQLRDRPLHAEHALRREDRRHDARRARLGLQPTWAAGTSRRCTGTSSATCARTARSTPTASSSGGPGASSSSRPVAAACLTALRRLADVLVGYSAGVQPGDLVP